MDVAAVQAFVSATLLTVAIKVLSAIAFWVVGRWIIQRVVVVTQAAMTRGKVDSTLTRYLGAILRILLNVALVLGILGYFGIQTTSFAALLAGAGVAVGAAGGGQRGHIAAGAFMLVLRPFKVGDVVSVAGITGAVHELGLFGTTLITPDNVMTIVGNGKIFGDTIQNFSALPVRRVDRQAQLAGAVDIAEASQRLRAALVAIPNVVAAPPPEVFVLDMNLNGPVLAVRPYAAQEHYPQVWADTNAAILRVASEAGWPAPTPVQITRIVQS
jgi:small conductance mechanosensitive channel